MIIIIEDWSFIMRYSRQREALVELLKSTTSHPDAEWLYTNLKKKYPNISLGTVYRNLRTLAQNGEILELPADGISHFDGDISEHYHFHCSKCGRIYDLPRGSVKAPEITACGFEISGFELMFRGICVNCKNSQ